MAPPARPLLPSSFHRRSPTLVTTSSRAGDCTRLVTHQQTFVPATTVFTSLGQLRQCSALIHLSFPFRFLLLLTNSPGSDGMQVGRARVSP